MCDFSTKSSLKMNKHKHREHPVPKPVKEVPKPKCQYCGNKFTRKYHLLIKMRYYNYLYRSLSSTVARCGYLPVPKSVDKCGVVLGPELTLIGLPGAISV